MRKKINIQPLILLLTFLFLLGCTPVLKVHTDYDKQVDFSKYKTFSFYGFTDKTSGISELNRNRIIKAINTEMIAHGFKQVDTNPDLYVNATTILKEKTQISSTNYYGYGGVYRPYYWGPGYSGTDYNVYTYNEGALIIDIIDGASKNLIWQSTGNQEIDVPLHDPDTFIPNAVKKILAPFPPTPKSK